jgi:hypothetical protein
VLKGNKSRELIAKFLAQERMSLEKLPVMFYTIKDFEVRTSGGAVYYVSRSHGLLVSVDNILTWEMTVEPHIICRKKEAHLWCFHYEGGPSSCLF